MHSARQHVPNFLASPQGSTPVHPSLSPSVPLCSLMGRGKIRVKPIISATVPLERGAEMFDRLYAKEANLTKVILNP